MDNAIRTGIPSVSAGNNNASPSIIVDSVISVVVRLSWFEAPSMTAFISL